MSRQERDEFQRGRESMHSEVEALRAQIPSWRPIAEAPKDGSVVWTEEGPAHWEEEWYSDLDGFALSPRFYLTGIPPIPEGL